MEGDPEMDERSFEVNPSVFGSFHIYNVKKIHSGIATFNHFYREPPSSSKNNE